MFRITTLFWVKEVTATELPEAMNRAEGDMEWLREADNDFENVRIILEVVDD